RAPRRRGAGRPRRDRGADRIRLRPRRGALRSRRRGACDRRVARPGLRAREHRQRPSCLRRHARRRGAEHGDMTRVAIVGGGIAGLAATLRAIERGAAVELFEAGVRLGGTLHTVRRDGFTIDTGPDSFITDKPWALALCERMGLAADLVPTRETDRRTYVA